MPKNAKPGNYFGKIVIDAQNQKKAVVQIQLKVQDKILPDPSKWDYHLELWQNMIEISRQIQ